MKTLGTTLEGKYIIEMEPDEYHSFVQLESSVNGVWGGDTFTRPTLYGKNLSPIFQALNQLSEAKISIFKLKEYINFLDDVFGKIK